MDQVSRPLLIALAAAAMLAAVWLVALRPSSPETADAPSGPVSAIAKAKQASAASDAANRRLQAATGGQSATGAPATSAAKPGAASAPAATAAKAKTALPKGDPQASIMRALDRGKVVVMLFWNGRSADDVATRSALRSLDRHHGRVAVRVVPVERVARYPLITRGVTISQSPTTLVIDAKRRVRTIVGLTEFGELTQAVDDARAGRR